MDLKKYLQFPITIKPYPVAYRFVFAAGVAVVLFLVASVIMILAPGSVIAMLRVVLPIFLFLIGAVWAFARLPWFLGFIVPSALFVLLAFLRLEGVYDLRLLIGYVPLALAGSLAMYVLVNYLRRAGKLIYE